MLYVNTVRSFGKLIAARVIENDDEKLWPDTESRWDWKSLTTAQEVADKLNEKAGELRYIATDAGVHVSPRYDVIELPKVGDKVSYAFNGDYYPCGVVTKISKTLRKISTSEGRDFYRVRQTGCWKNNGTWSLVPGHISRLNPEF